MKSEFLTRQIELLPVDKLNRRIEVIGCGATGSFVVLALAKMGFENIRVWDADVVSEENMNCQFFPTASLGINKAAALATLVEQFTGVKIEYMPKHWEGEKLTADIVINGADSMAVRKQLVEHLEWTNTYYIDPRIGSETILAYALHMMNDSDVQAHKLSLFDDKDGVQERCTAKAIMYTVLLVSGLVCKMVKDYVCQVEKPLKTVQYQVRDNQCLLFNKE